jgi:hypothetical protein
VALNDLDCRVLAALPMDRGAGRWPTVVEVAARAGVATDAAKSCLVELRLRYLADYDGVQGVRFGPSAAKLRSSTEKRNRAKQKAARITYSCETTHSRSIPAPADLRRQRSPITRSWLGWR